MSIHLFKRFPIRYLCSFLFLVLSFVSAACLLSACGDKSDPLSQSHSISGVFVNDLSLPYDGSPHSLSISNTLFSDTVLFSADGFSFSDIPLSFSEVGSYTVYFKVIRDGYADFFTSATLTITPIVLSGISAKDISLVYDSYPHSISVDGLLPSDTVYFSLDGFSFDTVLPFFSDVGAYTVFFFVERDYGEFRSSCSLTILPDLSGYYLNPSLGVIILTSSSAIIDGVDFPLSYDLNGCGSLDSIPFSVVDGVLSFNGSLFSLIPTSSFVFRLFSPDGSFVFVSAYDYSLLSISFSDNSAIVLVDDVPVMSVPDVNFCENADHVDYSSLTFFFSLSHDSVFVTSVFLDLSFRESFPLPDHYAELVFDGCAHSFVFPDLDVFLLNPDGSISPLPEFVDVGSYTSSLVVLSHDFLPARFSATLVILPDVFGVYVSDDCVIELLDSLAYINGIACSFFRTDGEWLLDGHAVSFDSDSLVLDDGSRLCKADNGSLFLIVIVDESSFVFSFTEDIDDFVIYIYDDYIDIECFGFDLPLFPLPDNGGSVSLFLNGIPFPPSIDDYVFIIGRGDIHADSAVIVFEFLPS